jgi:hypothetical protein
VSIRWRKLTSRRDAAAYRDAVEEQRQAMKKHSLGVDSVTHVPGAVVAGLISAEVAGPRLVDAQEGEGTLEDVATLLRDKTLSLDDLVDVGTGWVTLRDCAALTDAVEARERSDARRQWALRATAVVVLGGMAYGLVRLTQSLMGP